MKPGPSPKPTVLKKLAGNPGNRPLNDKEPEIREGKPTCPRHLNHDGKLEWKRISVILYEAGLLTYIDRALLASYCQHYGRWVEAEEKLKELKSETPKMDLVIRTTNGNFVQNPWIQIANKAQEQMIKLATEFGMSPSSRSRVIVQIGDKEVSLAELLFEGTSGD